MESIRYQLKNAIFDVPLRTMDALSNRSCAASQQLLITRHSGKRAYTYRDFWRWVAEHVPELRKRVRFSRLPIKNIDWNTIGLHTCWIADTLDVWSPTGYRHAVNLAEECGRNGVAMINSISRVAATSKSASTAIWRDSGIMAPRCEMIHDRDSFLDSQAGFSFPFLIRDDRGHGRPSTLVRRHEDLLQIDWQQLVAPMAAEFVDTCSDSDGLYRKYRCIVAGDRAIPRHMIANRGWEVRPEHRVEQEQLREEELEFVSNPVPYEDQLVYACQVLGLDWMGVDYSLTPAGIVLWEANPVANLNAPPIKRAGHLMPAVHRSYAALANLYLDRLGIGMPNYIEDLLGSFLPAASPDRDRNQLKPVFTRS